MSTWEDKKKGKIYRYILYCVYIEGKNKGKIYRYIFYFVYMGRQKERGRSTGIYFTVLTSEGKKKGVDLDVYTVPCLHGKRGRKGEQMYMCCTWGGTVHRYTS